MDENNTNEKNANLTIVASISKASHLLFIIQPIKSNSVTRFIFHLFEWFWFLDLLALNTIISLFLFLDVLLK